MPRVRSTRAVPRILFFFYSSLSSASFLASVYPGAWSGYPDERQCHRSQRRAPEPPSPKKDTKRSLVSVIYSVYISALYGGHAQYREKGCATRSGKSGLGLGLFLHLHPTLCTVHYQVHWTNEYPWTKVQCPSSILEIVNPPYLYRISQSQSA